MNDPIDDLIKRLAATTTDRSLAGFETEVGRRIRRRPFASWPPFGTWTMTALAPARVIAVGLALVVGATAGGLAAASALTPASQMDSFDVALTLAPSTLLEGAPR